MTALHADNGGVFIFENKHLGLTFVSVTNFTIATSLLLRDAANELGCVLAVFVLAGGVLFVRVDLLVHITCHDIANL